MLRLTCEYMCYTYELMVGEATGSVPDPVLVTYVYPRLIRIMYAPTAQVYLYLCPPSFSRFVLPLSLFLSHSACLRCAASPSRIDSPSRGG